MVHYVLLVPDVSGVVIWGFYALCSMTGALKMDGWYMLMIRQILQSIMNYQL